MEREREVKKQFKTTKKFVSLSDINVDGVYQRKLTKAFVQHLVDHFDPDALGIIHVSQREDGSCWAVDGQHRVNACRGFLGEGWEKQHVECLVYLGLTREEEAWLFEHLNNMKVMRPFDRFRARLVAQEANAVAIDKIAREEGFTIADGSGALSCVAVMEAIFKGARAQNAQEGPANLRKTLHSVAKAWGLKAPHPNGHIIQGLGLFLERYGSEIDSARLIRKLAEFSGGFSGLLGKARQMRDIQGGQVALAVFELIRRDYNIGLKGKKLNALRKDEAE